jgi:pilus assembly protein CpaE
VSGERRCLVVGGDPAVTAGVAAMIESAPGLVCGGVLEPAAAISGLRPVCDVIVACDAAGQTAIELAAPLIRTCGGVPVIVATAAPDIGAHRAALAVGARGVLGLPPEADELVRSVGSAAGARLEQESRGQAGRVVAICGAKGGCGVSAFAASVARAGRGLLIDMAGGFDDAAQRLGCAPRRSLADVAGLDDALSADALRSLVCTHPDGMQLVARSADPSATEMVSPELARALVRESRAVAALTLTDLGVATGEHTLAVAASADRSLLVVTPHPVVVDCAARAASWLDRRGVPGGSVGLVVNRWSRGGEMSLRGIERAVGVPVVSVVREGVLPGSIGRPHPAMEELLGELVA